MPTKKKSATKKRLAPRSRTAPPRARPSPPGRAGRVNEWMELRGSPLHGPGAFALKDIPKGTQIIEYTGEKISNAEADRRYVDEKMSDHHTFLFILNSKQ